MRGSAAHGVFQVYESMAKYTQGGILDPSVETPVIVSFPSTLLDLPTARDVRGFAVKFYTEEGNHDLVGNTCRYFYPVKRRTKKRRGFATRFCHGSVLSWRTPKILS